MKKILLFSLVLVLQMQGYSQNPVSHSQQNNDLISKFKNLPSQQLLDTAYYYFGKRSSDTALVCFSLIINTTGKDADFEQQKRVIEAYNKSGIIHCQMYDYRTGYEYFIKALLLCEKFNATSSQSNILLNLGHVYYHFNKFDIATSYCLEALNLCQDSIAMVLILNNLGASGRERENLDSVFYFLTQSLQISKQYNNAYLYYSLPKSYSDDYMDCFDICECGTHIYIFPKKEFEQSL
jgi:tetratricopeptide (TPR) repeat protein